MSKKVLGSCSSCGGDVVIKTSKDKKPSPPKCEDCGAKPAKKVIKMEEFWGIDF